ncbi:MAG: hypothetical protein WCK65_07940 [Rhodospirillaceae bacterium]
MKRLRWLFVLVELVLALVLVLVLAPPNVVQARGPWKSLPWHLADIYFDYPQPLPFRGLRTGIAVTGSLQDHSNIFLAVVFGHIGNTAFYFGLQTDLHDDRNGADSGPGVLFSRWGEGGKADARSASGGWSTALTANQSGEGAFVGVRLPYRWRGGDYEFLLVRRAAEDGRGWWADLLMYDAGAHAWIDAGGLRFPESADSLATSVVSFVELYGAIPTRDFPNDYSPQPMIVRFGSPELAVGGALPIKATAHTGAGIPHWASYRWTGDGVAVTVERPEPRGLPLPLVAKSVNTVLYGPGKPARRAWKGYRGGCGLSVRRKASTAAS